jgi:transcriptional regulator GlxA family with amidase domain
MSTIADTRNPMSNPLAIGIVVFDGVEDLDFVGPWEVLRLAQAAGADLRVRLYAVDETLAVTAARGLRFQADAQLGGEDLDLVIVPGGGWDARGPHGTWGEVQRGRLPKTLVDLHARGTTMASVCTGGMVLAAAGLLEGRPASTHKSGAPDLKKYGARFVDARVTDDGEIVTSGGVVAGIDLGLALVERYFGPELAAAVEDELEYTLRRDGR